MKKWLGLLLVLFLCNSVYAVDCKNKQEYDWDTAAGRQYFVEYSMKCTLPKANGYSEKIDILGPMNDAFIYYDRSEYTFDSDKIYQFITLEGIYNQLGLYITDPANVEMIYKWYKQDVKEYYKERWNDFKILEEMSTVKQLAFGTRLIKLAMTLDVKGYLKDYRALDIVETYLLSYMKFTTNEAAFKSMYLTALKLSTNNYNDKCINIPTQIQTVANTLAKKKGFQY